MGVALSTSSSQSGTDGGDGSGAADAANAQEQQSNNNQDGQQTGASSGGSDRGFPEHTPVKDMTVDQQAAYFRFQNRQTDNKLAAFKGVKPEDVTAMQQELENLRTEKLSADQKAVKEAEKAARAAADADWRPKLQTAQLRSIASEVLKGEQLDSWMFGRDPSAFANENGEIDQEKVMGHLTAAYGGDGDGQGQQSGNGQRQQPPAWGQNSGGAGAPPARPGEAGRAALAKRHGVKTT